jgi:hypothetical protein
VLGVQLNSPLKPASELLLKIGVGGGASVFGAVEIFSLSAGIVKQLYA